MFIVIGPVPPEINPVSIDDQIIHCSLSAENGTTFTSVNPATGETWAEVPEASEADVNRAVEAAHRAFSEGPWSTLTPTARGKMLRRLAEILAEHSEPLG